MQIKTQALTTLLNKKFHAVYILIGAEAYLFNEAAEQIKRVFQSKTQALSTIIEMNTAADWDLLISEANSYSLFSETILLDARYDKKTLDAAAKAALNAYLAQINERCLILLRAPNISAKSLTALANDANVLIVQNTALTETGFKQWITQQCRSRNLLLPDVLANHLYQYTQGNMLACAQLIEKLALCTPSGELISETILEEHLHDQAHFELYELADACLTAQPLKALRLLQYAQQTRVEPTLILWLFTQEIRVLIQIQQMIQSGLSPDAACKQLNIWSSKFAYYTKSISRFSKETLHQLLQTCTAIDESIKTGRSHNIWQEFDRLALKFA